MKRPPRRAASATVPPTTRNNGPAAHVETEPDTPVIVIPKVHTDEPPRTSMLDPLLAAVLL